MVIGLMVMVSGAEAQLRTMGKECRAQVAAADQMNAAGDFAAALVAFDAIVGKCKTKDAREAVQLGRAHALNRLGRHQEAMAAADAANAVWPKTPSVAGYFERAYAEEHLGNLAAAEADYNRIIELTEKNRNVAERATIYAKVADMYSRSGRAAEAEMYLDRAVELDPSNAGFTIMQGDWAVRAGDYDAAFAAYDRAVVQGRTDLEMYRIRTEARIKQMEEKYGTTNAQELRSAMNPTDTGLVCMELTRALDKGLRDMQLDMFSALVCQ
jgi:tetratricopeptide (TPR) repeat protein